MSEAVLISNDALKAVMTDAIVYRAVASDLDILIASGYYFVNGGVANLPSKAYPYGILRVTACGGFILQEYFPHQYYQTLLGGYWKRMKYNGNWKDWEYYAPSPIPS